MERFMIFVLMLILSTCTTYGQRKQTAQSVDQLLAFKNSTNGPVGTMTTINGAPIEARDIGVLGADELITNNLFMESLTHAVRERIPPRLVHAKGTVAHGVFRVTKNIADICKADMFDTDGKETTILARLSPAFSELGGSDTRREARSIAVKFYTTEGNFDLTTFHTPVFAIKDPTHFPTLVHSVNKNPATHLLDSSMLWDTIVNHPEFMHQIMYLMRDQGIPANYRHMPAFVIHTYQVYNKRGESHFIRFHFLPNTGNDYLTSEEASTIAGDDLDYMTRDLYNSIASGNFPSWTLYIQVLTLNDVLNAGFDVFDVTMILPEDKYPLREVGILTLNRNPTNFFAENEQLIFCPSNLIPGILGAPDTLFTARRMSYRDAQLYRLGTNYDKIPVNCPFRTKVLSYDRDGMAPLNTNMNNLPNYYPNSFNGPEPYVDKYRPRLLRINQTQPDNCDQVSLLYSSFSNDEKGRLVDNLVGSIRGVPDFLLEKILILFKKISKDLHNRASASLNSKPNSSGGGRPGNQNDPLANNYYNQRPDAINYPEDNPYPYKKQQPHISPSSYVNRHRYSDYSYGK